MPDRGAGVSRRLLASVRLRVTVAATLAVIAVLSIAGFALVQAQHRQLVDRVDETINQRASELVAELRLGNRAALVSGRGGDTVGQLIAADGRILAASPALEGKRALATDPYRNSAHTIRTAPLEGRDYRLVARPLSTPDGHAVLLVAGSLDDVAESTDAVRRSLLIGIPSVAAVLALLVWVLVGRLLRRVERATAAQQRFVADAAHELRTPIARMRAELEVDLAHPGTADPRATQRSLLEETIGLQHLADDLLLLARSDAGGMTARRQLVDLDVVIADECRAAAMPDDVTLDSTAVAPAQVRGDRVQLARAFRNVVENALRHARTTVEVAVEPTDRVVHIDVVDDGPGIPPEDRRRVFERFTRLDEARDAAGGGAGLGLAITREIVELHGGSVWMDGPAGGGTTVHLRLPTGS